MAQRIDNHQIFDDPVYRLVAYVEATFRDGIKVSGSGLLVGRNDLLTATHVVYNPSRGGLATSLEVYLGAVLESNSGEVLDAVAEYSIRRPDALHFGSLVFATGSNDTVTDAEAANDMAIVALPEDIGFELGWIPLSQHSPPSAFLGRSLGYPSELNGLTEGSVSVRSTASRNVLYSSSADATAMGAGSSGGPLLVNSSEAQLAVVGVKSAVSDSEGVWSNPQLHLDSLLADITANNSNLGTESRDVEGTANNDMLAASGGAVYWNAGDGNDYFSVSGGIHLFFGGDGIDCLELFAQSSSMQRDQTLSGLTKILSSSLANTSVVLDHVERVQFLDRTLAFDLQGNAGQAAKLVGAILGPEWVNNEGVMGIALDLLDADFSLRELVSLGLRTPMVEAVLGYPVGSERDAIRVVFKNIVGEWPSQNTVEDFYSQVGKASGIETVEDLILAAAEHPLNLENIDLVGLADQGLWYV